LSDVVKKTMRRIFFILSFFIFLTSSCTKNTKYKEAYGIVKDYTGLDGCGLMIDLDSGERLMPVLLPVNMILTANKRVLIKYKARSAFNNCMAGTTVEIISLQYL